MNLARLPAIGPRLEQRAARRDYYAVTDQTYDVLARMERRNALDADTRARLLTEYAAMQDILRQYCTSGWPLLDGPDLVVHGDAAHLVALVAAAESTRMQPIPENPLRVPFRLVLDDLRTARSIGQRCELLTRLYLAAVHIVGEDVADHVLLIRTAYERLALHPATEAAARTSA